MAEEDINDKPAKKRDDRWIDSNSLWVSYRELTAEESKRVTDLAKLLIQKRLWFQLSPQTSGTWRIIVKVEDVETLTKILATL